MKPVRAFAPVNTDGRVAANYLRANAYAARDAMGAAYDASFLRGWEVAKKRGWRIRPALVTLEPSQESTDAQ